MIFVVGGGSGGGGLSNKNAVLVVTVPTGSTVTAVKGSDSLKPTMWTSGTDSSSDCAIFSVPSSKFDSTNPWTVTATKDTRSSSATVIIDSNKQYEINIIFELILYESGDLCGYPWKVVMEDVGTSDPTGQTLLVQQNGNSNMYPDSGFVINSLIDFTPYSNLCAHIVRTVYVAKVAAFATTKFLGSSQFYTYIAGGPGDALASTILLLDDVPSDNIIRCDVSGVSKQAYVNVGARCTGHTVTMTFEVDRVWFE